jgi:biotin carboxylase
MKDLSRALRSSLASILSFALVAAPWPAWSQSVRIALPSAAVTEGAASAVVGARVTAVPSSLSATALAPLSAPSLSVSAAPFAATRASAASPASLAAPALSALPAARFPDDAAAAPAAPARVPAAALAAALEAAPASPIPTAPQEFVSDESVRGKTVVMVGTKGSRPFIMQEALRVATALGLNLVLVDDPANRANSKDSIPDSNFISAPVNTRDAKTMAKIAEAVAAHPAASQAHAVVGFMSLYANLTGKITDRLGVRGIPGASVAAADDKPEARKLLNKVPELEVPFREIKSAKQARAAYHEVSGEGKYKVVLKTIRGENSRFLAMGISSEEAAVAEYLKMDAAVRDFVSRPESKQTTFSAHPGIMMERMLVKAPGTEETSVEVVMQKGRATFAMVSDTKGIGEKGELAGGIMVFPSQQPDDEQAALIMASERALNALGITDGNARLDMMTTPDGPRVIEVNPFMGGVAIWQAVKSLTGMSLVEQGLRAVLGLKVDPGAAADGVIHYIFLASSRNGTLEGVEGLEAAKKTPGVELARVFVSPGDSIVAAKGNAYEEWAEIIGKGKTWRESIEAALTAARRLVLRIKRANGEIVRARGDYQQPTANDLAPLPVAAPAPVAVPAPAEAAAPSKAPGLFSKAVLGFLSTFVLVSTVVESTSLAVSQMTQPLSQGFLALAALTSVSYAAYTLGSFFGGSVIKRLGIRNSYRAVLAIRAVIWTTMALLFNPATGTIALALLIPLFSLDYFFHSIGRVAEHSLQVEWFRDSEAASSRFGSFRDFIEYGSVFVGSAMALAVAKFGFAAVIYPAPVAFAIAALIALALKLPKAAPDRKPGKWSDGFKTVFKNAGIYKPLAGFALVNSFLYMMYYIIATAFGAYAAPDPQHAAAVAGSLTAVYGVGALIGSVVMDRMAAAIDKKASALPEAERKAGEKKMYALSAAKVLPWAAAALLGSWLFLFPATIGTLIWPMFPVSLALLFIGFTAQMAGNHLDVIMKSNIPKGEKDMAVGAIRTLTYLTHVIGFLMWGGLFALFGAHAFALFAAFYTVVAGAYLVLARGLKRDAK